MITADPTPTRIEPPDDLDQAIRRLMNGVRDPEEVRRAVERMDRIREEIRQKHGTLDIGLPAIRELRGQ